MILIVSWNQLNDELNSRGSNYDIVRRENIVKLSNLTGRNTVIYYSGWLQKSPPDYHLISICDDDKTGFMSVFNNLDYSKGLDLILHTPGGETAATESIVTYIRSLFGENIRVIVPDLAMSAGTMIACASKEIIMGLQSSLGPIDPQFGGIPANGIIEEFERAATEIKLDPSKIYVWQPIIAKYNATLIGECEKAIQLSHELVSKWLETGMFKDDDDKKNKVQKIVKELEDHSNTKTHNRHLDINKCKKLGLNIISMDDKDNLELRELIMNVHFSTILTLERTMSFKIIENHKSMTYIKSPLI